MKKLFPIFFCQLYMYPFINLKILTKTKQEYLHVLNMEEGQSKKD